MRIEHMMVMVNESDAEPLTELARLLDEGYRVITSHTVGKSALFILARAVESALEEVKGIING